MDTETRTGFEWALQRLEDLGAVVGAVSEPLLRPGPMITASLRPEVAAVHRRWFAEDPSRYGAEVRDRMAPAFDTDPDAYQDALAWRAALRAAFGRLFAEWDLLATPTVAARRKVIGEEDTPTEAGPGPLSQRRSRGSPPLVNQAGIPAIALPLALPGEPPSVAPADRTALGRGTVAGRRVRPGGGREWWASGRRPRSGSGPFGVGGPVAYNGAPQPPGLPTYPTTRQASRCPRKRPHETKPTSRKSRRSGSASPGTRATACSWSGARFTEASAIFGNDLSTFPSYPAEIRAPADTLGGVSSFQVHIADRDILTPGDYPDVLVAMNPAALKANLADLQPAGTIIVNTDAFTERRWTKAGYAANPLEDGTLDGYTVLPGSHGGTHQEGRRGHRPQGPGRAAVEELPGARLARLDVRPAHRADARVDRLQVRLHPRGPGRQHQCLQGRLQPGHHHRGLPPHLSR